MSKKQKVVLRSDRGYLYLLIPYEGLEIKEYLGMKDSPANRENAEELAEQINAEIRTQVFSYRKHFPNSKNLERYKLGKRTPPSATLEDMIKQYREILEKELKTKKTKYSTYKAYNSGLNTFSNYLLIKKNIRMFHQSEVQEAIDQMEEDELSGKTIRNYMTPLRKVFKLAYRKDIIEKGDILDKVELPSYNKPPIRAFSKKEMLRILDYVEEHYPKAYPIILFLFATGVRGGEMCACKWENMNFEKCYYHVQEGFSVHQLELPKTESSIRKIRLPGKLIDVLKKLWLEQGEPKKGFMFLTSYGEPYTSTRHIIKDFWRPTLAALEIPYRRIYNTRHTYAVLSIDANDKLSNISKSMGHASMQMVLEVYSKPADEDPEDTNFGSTFDM